MGIKHDLLRGIYGYGYNYPSPIQQKAIPLLLNRRDVIAQAQSGTGKTAAFAIGLLHLVDVEINEVQGLVLCPTRELAQQHAKNFSALGEFSKVKVQACIGGTSLKKDQQNLYEGAHIIIGTPGRVLHLLDKKLLKLGNLKTFILDEADEMLTKGFLQDMKKAFAYIPKECTVGLFSATMPKEIVELTDQFMNDPEKILLDDNEVPLEGIKQYYIILKPEWKFEILLNLYKALDIAQAIIFCNSKKSVENLSQMLIKQGHMVSSIHSELPMEERTKVMAEFRSGVSRVLVTTDLLAKGIDVQNISVVINYDLPREKEFYIHRIGRTDRKSVV